MFSITVDDGNTFITETSIYTRNSIDDGAKKKPIKGLWYIDVSFVNDSDNGYIIVSQLNDDESSMLMDCIRHAYEHQLPLDIDGELKEYRRRQITNALLGDAIC